MWPTKAFGPHHFLKLYSEKVNREFTSFPENEIARLVEYDWPGNVRELEHVIERGTIMSAGTIFRVPELAPAPSTGAMPLGTFNRPPGLSLQEMEKHYIIQTLEQTNWKIRGADGAANYLRIHPSTLYSRMKKLGIRKNNKE